MLKVLTKGCEPTKGSRYSAAIDLYASEDIVIDAGETSIIGLGVCIDNLDAAISRDFGGMLESDEFRSIDTYREWFKESHYLELHPRSSLRAKGLISNTGIIDLDYKDEIKIIIHNPVDVKQIVENGYNYTILADSDDCEFVIKKGDRIAQIILKEHKSYLFGVESNEERVGGFGSTGE